MDRTEHITQLLLKFHQGEITAIEWDELKAWADSDPSYARLLDEFDPAAKDGILLENQKKFAAAGERLKFEELLKAQPMVVAFYRRNWVRWTGFAACILLLAGIGFNQYNKRWGSTTQEVASGLMPNPGKVAAVISTDNGLSQTISDPNGIQFRADGSLVVAGLSNQGKLAAAAHLTLIVPKGNAYTLVLSDGSKVWLNANSKISFSKVFGKKERKVQLEGEAYFEVAHDAHRPFFVQNDRQEIRVLGTSFNVKCYPEDHHIITSLFQGSVEVEDNQYHRTLKLVPGEASNLDEKANLVKHKADLARVESWRMGLFNFNNTPFEEVIKQIARWYNVEVVYRNGIPKEFFSGEVSRNIDFDLMLQFLQGSGIRLNYEQGKLIIH